MEATRFHFQYIMHAWQCINVAASKQVCQTAYQQNLQLDLHKPRVRTIHDISGRFAKLGEKLLHIATVLLLASWESVDGTTVLGELGYIEQLS